MIGTERLYRLTAFSDEPGGGNPAGVWLGERLPEPEIMQRIAAGVGYSETAFVAPCRGRERAVRYYSPKAEVSFCGHATIATGIVLGRTHGVDDYLLETGVGPVALRVDEDRGVLRATLTSVPTRHEPPAPQLLDSALDILGWGHDDLDMDIPPARAFAGAWHLILAARRRSRLDRLEYDFEALRAVMLEHDLTTLQLVWRECDDLFHSRNPFPVGGVVEDAATGAAAAALGGYLRDAGLVRPPVRFTIRQGEAMGRPSRLDVRVPVEGGIQVTGTAVELDAESEA